MLSEYTAVVAGVRLDTLREHAERVRAYVTRSRLHEVLEYALLAFAFVVVVAVVSASDHAGWFRYDVDQKQYSRNNVTISSVYALILCSADRAVDDDVVDHVLPTLRRRSGLPPAT